MVAAAGDMALVGGGCMGFVDTTTGVRAIGYLERDPLPVGPIALVTHSGSVFSAMLRTHRRAGVLRRRCRSGQELVTHDGRLPGLRAVAARDPGGRAGAGDDARRAAARRPALAEAAARDIPVCALTVGYVGARAGAGRRPLRRDRRVGRRLGGAVHGVRRAPLRRPRRPHRQPRDVRDRTAAASAGTGRGLATAHDSGAERVLVADVAERLGVRFADAAPSRPRAADGAARPGPEPDEPARRLGQRRRHRGAVRRVPRARWPTTRRSARWRWRWTWSRSTTATRSFPRRAGEPAGADRQAGGRARQPAVGRRPGRRRPAAGAGDPGARGHGVGAARARAPAGRRRRGRGPRWSSTSGSALGAGWRRRALDGRLVGAAAATTASRSRRASACRRRGTRPSAAADGYGLPGGAQERRRGASTTRPRRTAYASGSVTATPSARRTTTSRRGSGRGCWCSARCPGWRWRSASCATRCSGRWWWSRPAGCSWSWSPSARSRCRRSTARRPWRWSAGCGSPRLLDGYRGSAPADVEALARRGRRPRPAGRRARRPPRRPSTSTRSSSAPTPPSSSTPSSSPGSTPTSPIAT